MDGTLSESHIQVICAAMIASNTEVWIVTSRVHSESNELTRRTNSDVFKLAKELNIPENRIIFTQGDFKWRKLKELEIDLHFDDIPEEAEQCARNCETKVCLVWDIFCSASIKSDEFGKALF